MEGDLLDVDLDSYQTTLEEVLTWLLSAEDALHVQDEVSEDVEEVKEQFHTHEVRRAHVLHHLCFVVPTLLGTQRQTKAHKLV